MSVDRSKITTGLDLTLDSFGPMTIKSSRLTANGGSITLPPRNNLDITGSNLAARENVTLGGPGGRRDVSNSTLAPGAPQASRAAVAAWPWFGWRSG